MDLKWSELEKLENDVFIKIIVGEQPVEALNNKGSCCDRSGKIARL